MIRKKSLKPLPKLKARAEKVFHAWIVNRDKGICITCHQPGNQAGHFRHNKLDFDEINLNCQCTYCNHFKRGELGLYALFLIIKYGQDRVEELIRRSNEPLSNKHTRDQLEEIILKYKL